MNFKEILLLTIVNTATALLTALVQSSGIGPNFKAACQATLNTLPTLVVAAETPNQ